MAERELTEEELREEEARKKAGRASLDEEIARRYEPGRLSRIVARGAGRGEKLDLATRSDMARVLPGHDFDNVRVFRGPFAEEVTARHKADAVTVANTGMILVRETPRSAPGTSTGRALLAHELTHVAQAQRGMHFALAHESGHGDHEAEAEEVERRASQHDAKQDENHSRLREEARRRAIIDRAIELLGDDARHGAHRSGGEWER